MKIILKILWFVNYFSEKSTRRDTMKNVIKTGAVCYIFGLSSLSMAIDPIPSAVSEAAPAVVKVTVHSPNSSIQGTGFAVTNKIGQVFIVTTFDLIHSHSLDTTRMQLRENSVEVEALSGRILKIKGLTDFSLFSNLALIEVTGYKGPALKLSHFNETEDKTAYLMEFPWNLPDQLKQMKIVGVVPADQTSLSGFSYLDINQKGNGGGPLLNRGGTVIGIAQNRRLDYMPYFTQSGFLKSLLEKTEKQQSELDLMDQFKKEMSSLTAFSKADDSEARFRLINIRTNTHDNPYKIFSDPEAIDINSWKRKAILTGDMRSLYVISFIVQERFGFDESLHIFKLAAKGGHPGAMHEIGLNYLFEKKDKKRAMFWFKKAAEKGNPYTKFLLARHNMPNHYRTPTDITPEVQSLLNELVEEEFPIVLDFLEHTNIAYPVKPFNRRRCHTSLRRNL